MKNPALSIPKLLKEHKKQCPESMLSLRTIRQAVLSGDLRCIKSGSRTLIPLNAFEEWLDGICMTSDRREDK